MTVDDRSNTLKVNLLDRQEERDYYVRVTNASDKIYGESIAYYEENVAGEWQAIGECEKWYASEYEGFMDYQKPAKSKVKTMENYEKNIKSTVELNVDCVYGLTVPIVNHELKATRIRLVFDLFGTTSEVPYREEVEFILPLN